MTDSPARYSMTLSLNLLNHLGLNLYSNSAAVLAEVVANAWDADAENVDIVVDLTAKRAIVTDDGHGMTAAEVNLKYLTIGYQRRAAAGGAFSPLHNRPVMGRKGIGKLSLFSIADTIEVHTVKGAEKSGFRMSLAKIRETIESGQGEYHPEEIDSSAISITKGTRIVLSDPRRSFSRVARALRRRLARRFSVIGDRYKFAIALDGNPISIADREYYSKLEYAWVYGGAGEEASTLAKNLKASIPRDTVVTVKNEDESETEFKIEGWIGSVLEVSDLRDEDENLNSVIVMVRGKLAQEDILEECGATGMVTKYLIGEIHADFLDNDAQQDIATSSRQSIVEDDPRYVALRDFMKKEIIAIRYDWTNHRGNAGTSKALQVPELRDWFKTLSTDDQRRARSLFGKINQLTTESEAERRKLLKHSVLAFESFRYKKNLDAIENLTAEDLESVAKIFSEFDDIEATLYHQIVNERVEVIRVLREKVEGNAKEKVIQQHLFTHLWLLDPSWERSTGTEYMEQSVKKEFDEIDAGLTDDEKAGRLDLKYQTASGKHVIIELKRASVVLSTSDVSQQMGKYRSALSKMLAKTGRAREPIECVCVVGRPLRDWDDEPSGRDESARMLMVKHMRVVLYDELIDQAYRAYQTYLEKSQSRGRVLALIQSIEKHDFE
jgi:hypothetical protein